MRRGDMMAKKFTRLKLEDQEFKITGVNQYKIALEQQIENMRRTVKELERNNHYAEIAEKRMSKEVNEKIVFIQNEERDKGMSALKQLEFMNNKIDTVNR